MNTLSEVCEENGTVTGEYHDTLSLYDEAIPCVFDFYGKVSGSGEQAIYSSIVLTRAEVKQTGFDMLAVVGCPQAWASIEDDIESELAYAAMQQQADDPEPLGQGYMGVAA